ncbi:MAG: methyltransferase domain-containing protein [Pseudomonadota bacterium]
MHRSNEPTRRLFTRAGISAGMRVLEVGCGSGEVTSLLAQMVGSAGFVLAVDSNQHALNAAEQRLLSDGARNFRFMCADVSDPRALLCQSEATTFDAVAGRRVLMYLDDPVAVLSGLRRWLSRDCIVVFEEIASTLGSGGSVSMPAHEQASRWLSGMLDAEGAERSLGLQLPSVYARAGFVPDGIWAEAVIEGQGEQYSLGELLSLLQERLAAAGIASKSDIESLLQELADEAADPGNVYVSSMRVCARGQNTLT